MVAVPGVLAALFLYFSNLPWAPSRAVRAVLVAPLFNGYAPQLAYERGDRPADATFAEVMQRYSITAGPRSAPVDSDFSARIREGLGEPSASRKP